MVLFPIIFQLIDLHCTEILNLYFVFTLKEISQIWILIEDYRKDYRKVAI